MDCESFERVVLDRMYLELDELAMGEAQRHVSHCSRCRNIEAELKAVKEVCRLPLLTLPASLKDEVLSDERQLRAVLPMRQRASRTISVLASYAMRPQPTMALLLLLMIGASLFLIRTRPPERDLVQVTERGVPEGDGVPFQQSQRSSANSVANNATIAPAAESRPSTAVPILVSAEPRPGRVRDPDLQAAESLRELSGCAVAVPSFEAIRRREPNSAAGLAATLQAAECYAKLNRKAEARSLLDRLVAQPEYSEQASAQLRALGQL